MKFLKILESRNRCLSKILENSEFFLSRLTVGDLTGLDSFETRRNSAIKTLTLYDNQIKILLGLLSPDEKNEDFRSNIRNVLEISKNIIYYIKHIDDKIIGKIEMEKNRLLNNLAAAERKQKTFTKFRSESAAKSGGQLDGKI